MKKVFIDGSAGTTGLRIFDRLSARDDLSVVTLPDAVRKDPMARAEALNSCDLAFLCLPDAAAIEAAAMVENPDVVLLDTSTAHRTDPAWAYGFPELSPEHAEKVRTSRRIAVPGCHASGFIALVYPLIASGVLPSDALLSCHSLTGYSGGGKKMIADYESEQFAPSLAAPRMYGLSQMHKHLPEMAAVCGLGEAPVFSPVVSSYYAGMEVVVPLFREQVKGGIEAVRETYRTYYTQGLVRYAEADDENGFLSAGAMAGEDDMHVGVWGSGERLTLVSRFDNLGKGASGAAIQNMNIILGVEETTGLITGGQSK